MATEPPILQIEHLAVSYFTRAGEIPAVPDFSLTLERGQSYGLVGESGCGKTTVAMAIMRYLGSNGAIVNGRLLFEGNDLVTMSGKELRQIRGSKISMIYQDPMSALNPSLTVGRQLREVPVFHDKVSHEEAHERAINVLADVRMSDPAAVMARFPHQLSGGQQQRVVIAMALLSNPTLMLLDEPTTALDVTVEATVVDLIAELRDKYNTALIYISHNLGLIVKVCERVGVMYSGELVEEGTVEELFAETRHPYTLGLLECIPKLDANKHTRGLNPIRGQVSLPNERPTGCLFAPRCDYAEPGRCDQHPIPVEAIPGSPTQRVRCLRWQEVLPRRKVVAPPAFETAAALKDVLRVRQLDKFYDQDRSAWGWKPHSGPRHYVKANEGLTFDVKKGHILAIVGESGCGKSTFAKVLTGLETATSGEIEFHGQNIAGIPVQSREPALVRALQMVFQNPNGTLNPKHSVGWAIGRVIRKVGDASGRDAIRHRVGDLLELVRMPRAFAGRKPRQLSGGQKQRIAIARAFAGNPALVIADEPVSSLDVSVQAAVVNLLTEVQRKYDTTLLFISHDLSLVRYLADHVIVMYLGQIMESGPAGSIFNPPYHPYTEALLSAVPLPDPMVQQKRVRLEGEMPSAVNPPKGCRFASRCPRKLPGDICDAVEPPEHQVSRDHRIKCHISIAGLRKIEPVFTSARAVRTAP